MLCFSLIAVYDYNKFNYFLEVPLFSLVKELGIHETLKRESVPLVLSFMIAEFFYKFHSFALECMGFLATWIILSYLQSLAVGRSED